MKAHFPILVTAFAALLLTACGGDKPQSSSSSQPIATETSSSERDPVPSSSSSSKDPVPSSSEKVTVQYNFTFDLNYEGSTPIVIQVDEGEKAVPIDEPQRDDYLFDKWLDAKEDGEEFDFNTPITSDTTVYASWTEAQEENVASITFHWNIPDVENTVIKVEKGKRVTLPTTKEYAGHLFRGWYLENAFTNRFATTTTITESFDLYARYDVTFTMEAEYVDLDEKPGRGYSANVEGADMIGKDVNNAGASNGYFVSYLYYNGAFLQFDFTSDKAVTDAALSLRLSVEFYDMSLSDEDYVIEVNGVALSGYYLELEGAIAIEQSDTDKRPFENYEISTAVALKEGGNSIKLITNNENFHGGTMGADAPIVDCVYLSSSSTLSWNPVTSNLNGK